MIETIQAPGLVVIKYNSDATNDTCNGEGIHTRQTHAAAARQPAPADTQLELLQQFILFVWHHLQRLNSFQAFMRWLAFFGILFLCDTVYHSLHMVIFYYYSILLLLILYLHTRNQRVQPVRYRNIFAGIGAITLFLLFMFDYPIFLDQVSIKLMCYMCLHLIDQ